MNIEELAGLPDVEFDFEAATALQRAAKGAAEAVSISVDKIGRSSEIALQDFSGYFADLFRDNASTAKIDGRNIATCLSALARYTGELISAAREENRRRAYAREWAEERKAISLGSPGDTQDPFADAPLPFKIDEVGPNHSVSDVVMRTRMQPRRGDGGGGRGTSSANPAKLRAFATQDLLSAKINGFGVQVQDLTGKSTLPRLWDDFLHGCRWGTLTDGGATDAVGRWFAANGADMTWIRTVADAFEAAGGVSTVSKLSNASIGEALKSAGVNPVRDGIDVTPPTLKGALPTTGYANDPVNTATGNFIEPESDLEHSGASASLSLARMYNSIDETGGVFGQGWSSVLDTRLELSDEGAVFVMPDGRNLLFPREGDGWARAECANFWLADGPVEPFVREVHGSEEVLEVRDNAGGWWAFSHSGLWLGHGSGPGSAVVALRDDRARLVALRHEFGREIEIDYSDGRVAAARASDGRRVEYRYDGENRLVSAAGAAGTRSYRWNEGGLIDRVTAATGVVECENLYDDRRRVVEQITEFGRTVRFAYLPGRATCVSDADGSNSNTWVSDRKGRLIAVIDTDERRQSMAYDRHGNPVSVTERDGSTTVNQYDERGRCTRTVTAEGADTAYEWDEHDRLIRVVSGVFASPERSDRQPEGSTRAVTVLEYASTRDRHPSRVIDPLGGVTLLLWRNGLLSQVTDPVGVATSFAYDAHGELVEIMDSVGNRTRLIRDEAGRVVEKVTPAGNRTSWEYDDAGNATARRDPDGAVWSFEYGSGATITAQIDPCGARTEYEYGAHGGLVRVTDALGRVAERLLDAFGNLAAVTLPDGAEWLLRHDGLSRLRELVDPDGGVWARSYDPIGRPAGVTDPTGAHEQITRDRSRGIETVRTAFTESITEFDEYGRPVKVTAADGGASITVYDLCGRVVEEIDAEGGLAKYERDAAGRVTRVTSPAGRATHYEYDECGRPSAMIDGLGGRTELVYDADSRVVERRLANGDVACFEYDPMGRLLSERVPGSGVSRYGYDRAGRLVSSQDSRYGRRRFVYDAAGQLVRAINGLGGETRYDYDRMGRLVTVTDPLGGVSRREYTALLKVSAVTDPLGRTTTAHYDAAGRQLTQRDPDGGEVFWEYDRDGRLCVAGVGASSVEGRPLARIAPAERSTTETVDDFTRGDGAAVTHLIARDRLGRLTERSRGGRVTRWEYDPDGLRTRMVTSRGEEVSYDHDPAGRLVRVVHSAFGEIAYEYDAAGNLLSSTAGDLAQAWKYRDGYPVEYTRADADGVAVTVIERDDDGRITKIHGADGAVCYEYDAANQLVGVTSDTRRRWEYDAAGRLIREHARDGAVEYRYDAVGQLIQRTSATGGATRCEYDGLGRRARETGAGGEKSFVWDERGWLAGVTENGAEHRLWVDALGELAEADGRDVDWDTAAAFPALTSVSDTSIFAAPGGVTGVGGSLTSTGWRSARATRLGDPWDIVGLPFGPSGLGVTAHGAPTIAGLEWMGARAYDPLARGFLSVDPLAPVIGAGWSANPYAFAGNDPMHTLDPLGLRPATDTEIRGLAQGQWDSLISQLKNANGAGGAFLGSLKIWDDRTLQKIDKRVADLPPGVRSLAKLAKAVPYLGTLVTIGKINRAWESGNHWDLTNYSVSVAFDLIGLIPPAAPFTAITGFAWDFLWGIGTNITTMIQNPGTYEKTMKDPLFIGLSLVSAPLTWAFFEVEP